MLGDCVDRGNYGFRILKEVIEDPRFILLKGNHEDLFAESIKAKTLTYLHAGNGGQTTVESWLKDGADEKWLTILSKLPTHLEYVNKNGQNVLLSHSGYTPGLQEHCDPSERYLWNKDPNEDFYCYDDGDK